MLGGYSFIFYVMCGLLSLGLIMRMYTHSNGVQLSVMCRRFVTHLSLWAINVPFYSTNEY